MFPVIISCAAIFITVFLSNRKMKYDISKDNEKKFKEKANLIHVISLNAERERDIEEVKESIRDMQGGNSEQHKLLFDKVNTVAAGVARIEGYLKAKNEK